MSRKQKPKTSEQKEANRIAEHRRYHSMTAAQRRHRHQISQAAADRRKLRNKKYVRSFPCRACGNTTRTEWHHPNGDGTIRNRLASMLNRPRVVIEAALRECVPLCLKCHRIEHARMRRRAGIFPKRIRAEREARICL